MMVNVTPGSIPRSLQHVLRLWVCDWLHQHGIQFHCLPGLQGPLISVRHAGRGKPCHQWCSCHKQQHKKDQKPLTERLVFCEGGRGCYDFMCRMLCHKCIAYEFIVVYVKTYRSHCEILVTCCTRMLRVTLHGCLFRLGDRFFMKCRPNHLCYIDLF